jgi:hypothetical protein
MTQPKTSTRSSHALDMGRRPYGLRPLVGQTSQDGEADGRGCGTAEWSWTGWAGDGPCQPPLAALRHNNNANGSKPAGCVPPSCSPLGPQAQEVRRSNKGEFICYQHRHHEQLWLYLRQRDGVLVAAHWPGTGLMVAARSTTGSATSTSGRSSTWDATLSTVKKSQARIPAACWRRNACHVVGARRGAGSGPWRRSVAAASWPAVMTGGGAPARPAPRRRPAPRSRPPAAGRGHAG